MLITGFARRYAVAEIDAVTLRFCDGRPVTPRPLVPVPSDAKLIVCVPAIVPAADVSSDTTMLDPSVPPAASWLTVPPLFRMRASFAPPKLAFRLSEYMSATAVLLIDTACDTMSPTCTLPRLNASGLSIVASARRYTLPDTAIDWLPAPIAARPLVPVPSDV